MFGKRYPNCVKKTKKEEVEVDTSSVQLEAKVDKVIYPDKPEGGKKLAQGQRSPGAVGRTTLRNMRKFDSATGHGDSTQRTMETSIRRSEHGRKRGVKTKDKFVPEAAELKKANINYNKNTDKDGNTIYKVNKNDESDAQAVMKKNPKFVAGKLECKQMKKYWKFII